MTAPLADAVREVERHLAAAGWDAPPALFALVPTADLVRDEPELATELGIADVVDGSYTPVEQEALTVDAPLPDVLARLDWPAEVAGVVLGLETVSLPAEVEADAPTGDAAGWAVDQPGRQDARVVVGVLRDGSRATALRWRSHDTDDDVVTGPDLAPAVADALLASLRLPS